MNFYEFMNMYDNWNGNVVINDDELNPLVEGNIYDIMVKRRDLHNREVIAFGFYDGVMTVRIK